MWKVQLFKLNYDEREINAVNEVLESGWITMGEKTKLFEERFANYHGSDISACAVSNGTAALHLALMACGIKESDEVIIPSLTFVADMNVVNIVGATPVLADSTSLTDWNISPTDIERKITDKTKAIIIVHFAGYPCDMDAIIKLCEKYNLLLIEDVAHAPGASYKGKKCGTFGIAGCFSFFTNKNLSVGEGGMVISKDHEFMEKIHRLRSHGMTTLTLDRFKGRSITYDVEYPGLNYRIDEMRSALGLVQLEKLNSANKKREAIVLKYCEAFSDCRNIMIPFKDLENTCSSYHIFPILLSKDLHRITIIEKLNKLGIQTSIHYPSFLEFSSYKGNPDSERLEFSRDISARELTLPLYPEMTNDEVNNVVTAVLEVCS